MARWHVSKNKKVFNAQKVEVDGIKFDSKLELYMYQLLQAYKVPFEFQVRKQLFPKFTFFKENIREMYMVIDFVIKPANVDTVYYADTKGFATEKSILKYKILRYRLKEEYDANPTDTEIEVLFLKNRTECSQFALRMLAEHKLIK